MALPVYVTVEAADILLAGVTPWTSATPEAKLYALQMARVYTDANYRIKFDLDEDVPENVQYGNALLGDEQLTSDIFTRQDGKGAIEETFVKAGPVETKRRYTNIPANSWKDPFPKVTAIMRPDCILMSGGGLRNGKVIR